MATDRIRLSRLQVAGIVVLVCGALLLVVGDRLAAVATGPGMVLLGVALLLGGLDSVLRREHTTGRDSARIDYRGTAARAWGVAFLLAGLAVVVAGVVVLAGAGEDAARLLGRRPGIALVPAGLFLLAVGRGMTGSWRRATGEEPPRYVLMPGRIGGVLVMLVGLAVLLAGLSELVAPAWFDGLVDRIGHSLPSVPAPPG